MKTSIPRDASVEAVSDTAPAPIARRPRRWRNHVVTFLLFLGLGVVFLLPGSLHPSTALLGYPGDNFQHAWFVWHFARAVADGQDPFYTRLLFYPSRVTLAWSTNDAVAAAMALPLSLTAGPVIAYNLALILQLALAAFFGRLLCLRITRNEPASFIGGIAFGFSACLLAQALGHLSLVTAFAIPLFVLALDRIFRAGNSSWRLGIPLGLALLLAALSHYNYVVVCVLFTFFWLAFDTARDFRARGLRLIMRVWKPLAAGAATFAVGFSPLLWMMVGHPADIPLARTAKHLDIFSADVLGFGIPSWNHIVFGRFARAMNPRVFVAGYEGTVYAGLVVLALAAIGFWKGRKSHGPWVARAAALAAIFYLLSLGPELRFLGRPMHIPGPAALFYSLPFAKFMSAPARFDVGVALCLAILASIGVKFVLETIAWRSGRYLALGAFAALVICDSLTVPFPRSSIADPGRGYSSAAITDPTGSAPLSCNLPEKLRHGTVLTFPLVHAPYCLKSMWMQVADGGRFALIDGYLSYTPPEVWEHLWDVPIMRSLMSIEGLVQAPVDVAADRKTAVATIRELNLSAIVVYDAPESSAAEKYVESVFGVKPQRQGNCTVFAVQR